jgi:hypothetical protein
MTSMFLLAAVNKVKSWESVAPSWRYQSQSLCLENFAQLSQRLSNMIRKLGRQVSRIGFGGFRVNNVTHGEALRKAIVSGVNIVDTAANFEKGKSSAYLGQDVSPLT